MNFITSDLHFYHENIIALESRPYPSLQDMHSGILREINSLPNGSTLYQLGDFTLSSKVKKLEEILEQIKKEINLISIPGNHDHRLEKVFAKYGEVHRLLERNFFNTKVVMCHFPMYEWNRAQHGAIHFHGHCHGHFHAPGRALDVGWDYKKRILSMEEAMKEAAAKPIYQPCHSRNNGMILDINFEIQ